MTYTVLQAKIAAWLNRTDLTALVPDFIALAEERINRDLRVRQMEVALLATTIADNRIAVPPATVGVKSLWLSNCPQTPLRTQTFESVLAMGLSGSPTHWAWQGSDFYFNGAGGVQGVLYQAVPTLSDASPTNWLLTASLSIYLFGGLYEAAIYIKDADAEARFGARFNATLEAIAGADKRDALSGPLVSRVR